MGYLGFFMLLNQMIPKWPKFGRVSIKINSATISNIDSSTQFTFLLEWKFRFHIDGHFEIQLEFIVGSCCLIIQHFFQYNHYQKSKIFNMYNTNWKITNTFSNGISFPLILMHNIKVEQIFDTQTWNISLMSQKKQFDWAFYAINILSLYNLVQF
jgi:hypothetical protein